VALPLLFFSPLFLLAALQQFLFLWFSLIGFFLCLIRFRLVLFLGFLSVRFSALFRFVFSVFRVGFLVVFSPPKSPEKQAGRGFSLSVSVHNYIRSIPFQLR